MSQEAIVTIRESRRDLAVQNTFTRFGTVVPMCKACGGVRVAATGDVCMPCVRVIMNRDKMLADQVRARRQLTILCAGIIAGLVAIAIVWLVQ